MKDANHGKEELQAIAEISSHDLVGVNLLGGWAATCFLWPMDRERIFDLALGRHRIFAYIDYAKLIARAEKHGIKMTFVPVDLKGVKGVEREQLQKMSFPLPGMPTARAIRISNDKGQKSIMMSGFVTRLLAEHMLPDFFIELMGRTLDQSASKHEPETSLPLEDEAAPQPTV